MSKKFNLRAGMALSGIVSLAALTPANARPPAKARRAATHLASSASYRNPGTGYEKSLLGVRVLQSYKVALAKLGQPDRILRADEYVNVIYDIDAKGNYTGGILDITSGGDVSKDTPNSVSPGGGPPGSENGDNPGDPSAAGDPSAQGGPNAGGLNNNTQEKPPETFGQSGGYLWIYRRPKEKKAYALEFNRDGRALLIVELGMVNGSPTRRGIHLGSPVTEVYQKYGWPDSVQENKENMQLFYNLKHHCQFDIVNNKVSGIYVALSEGTKIRVSKDHNGGGGNNPGGGNGGGGGAGQRQAPPPPPSGGG